MVCYEISNKSLAIKTPAMKSETLITYKVDKI